MSSRRTSSVPRCCFSQNALLWFEVLPDAHRFVAGAPRCCAMQRDPSPGRQAACNSPSEGTRFRQSRQSRPEHPGVSDGNQGCCWCPPSPLSVLVSLLRFKCDFACSLRSDGCHCRRNLHRHIHRRVAPPVRHSCCVQAAPLAPSDFGHHFCEARLFQRSPHHRLLVCWCVGSVVWLPRLRVKTTQLRGSSCAPSSCGLAGAGTLAPGSIRCPELIAAVRFLIAMVVVDLSRCFCFAKTFWICLEEEQLLEE